MTTSSGAVRVYDNTPTTVFVIGYDSSGKLLCIRRAKNPGYGLLGLPGGYQMRGESWQEAAVRELLEETGCSASVSEIEFQSIHTDEYGNNLIIASCTKFLSVEYENDGEALEVIFSNDAGDLSDWAHPDLYHAARTYLDQRWQLGWPSK